MKKRSELAFSLALVPIDYAMLVAGFVIAYFIREGQDKPFAHPTPGISYLHTMLIMLPLWIIIFASLGLYNLSSTRRWWSEIGRIAVATAGGTMVLILVDFASQPTIFPAKSIPVYGFIATFGLVVVARYIVRQAQRFLFRFGVGQHNVLVLGENRLASKVRDHLEQSGRAYRLINKELEVAGLSGSTPIDVLQSIYADYGLDELILTDLSMAESRQLAIIDFAQSHQIAFKFVPTVAGLYSARTQTGIVGDIPLLEISQTPLEGWGRIVKRGVDILGSLLGLIVLSPLMILLAVIIKITDPGPVFYGHERLSRSGKRFRVLKFRSMKLEFCDGGKFGNSTPEEALATFNDPALLEEWRKHQKLKRDPRVSAIGRFTRKTSLDELPQLFNVLGSELSLVGPRPIITSELERYGKGSSALLAIKPGMTGLWQVSGRSDISYGDRVKLDVFYAENWNLWLDIRILYRTVLMVLKGRGGY